MSQSPAIQQLIESLRCLPGVGPKSAQRMALHILERDRAAGAQLAESLQHAIDCVGRCQHCRTLTEESICQLCASPRREANTLCVVENPSDVYAIEHSGEFRGRYFVLLGKLSPIDGIGAEDIGIPDLLERVASNDIEEVILATSATLEGEATAFYIAEQIAAIEGVIVSRIAHGVPMGGELEYVDGGTIARAINGRSNF
jgi:recombination protein RecR